MTRFVLASLLLTLSSACGDVASLDDGRRGARGRDDRRGALDERDDSAERSAEDGAVGDDDAEQADAHGDEASATGDEPSSAPSSGDAGDAPAASPHPCASLPEEGTCEGDLFKVCVDGAYYEVSCPEYGAYCGRLEGTLGCVSNIVRVLDEEQPLFFCEGQSESFRMMMGHGVVWTENEAGEVVEGTYTIAEGLAFDVPGRLVGGITEDYEVQLDMVLSFQTSDTRCEAIAYELDVGFDVTVECKFSSYAAGLYLENTTFDFDPYGHMSRTVETMLDIDTWTDFDPGVYRLEGDRVLMAFFTDDQTVAIEAFVDENGALNVPSFHRPVCGT